MFSFPAVQDSLLQVKLVSMTFLSLEVFLIHYFIVNRRYTFVPAAVVTPKTPQDVSAILKAASANGFQVAARGGGVRLPFLYLLHELTSF